MTQVDFLHKAFLLSKKANFKDISPNPYVGAIVVNEREEIIGEGFHKMLGGPHAEVLAIQEAFSKYNDLSKSTLYVTLEPCSHFGRTPPCTNLILEHKIKKVVIGSLDPNPKVSGASILREKGVEVIELFLPEIEELNRVFMVNQKNKRPFFQLKVASTLNGKIADSNGNSKWISNSLSRQFVHKTLRNNVAGILTTAKTIIKDNSKLNIRIIDESDKELSVIVIDKNLELLKPENINLALFYPRVFSKIYLVTPINDVSITTKLKDYPIEILLVPFENGKVNIELLNKILLEKNMNIILIEAGGKLNSSFFEYNCIDELYLFIAPKVINDSKAIGIFENEKSQLITEGKVMKLKQVQQLEEDVLLIYENNSKSTL